jgi:hypothetical protein
MLPTVDILEKLVLQILWHVIEFNVKSEVLDFLFL